MNLDKSPQESFLIKSYKENHENWDKKRIIKIPSSFKIYQEIIGFLSDKLSIPLANNLQDILETLDFSFFEMQKDFGINKITEMLYEIPPKILLTYYSLCKEILVIYKDHLIQRQPTIRFHFQNENCFQFYPFWHSDPILGHPPFEKNIWIPLTQPNKDSFHGFSISTSEISAEIFRNFCERSPYQSKNNIEVIKNKSFEKYSTPVDCEPGEAIVFDSRRFHSALPHSEPRLSLDIRIIHKKYLSGIYPIYTGLGRKKMRFDSKNYFVDSNEIESLELNCLTR